MAKVLLDAIGETRDRFLPDALFLEQRQSLGRSIDLLRDRRAEVRAGWGPGARPAGAGLRSCPPAGCVPLDPR